MPYTGFRASNTDQSLERFVTPTMARKPNQTSTIEPNTLPMLSVPRDCTEKRITMITTVIIRVRLGFSSNNPSNGGRVCKPSTAELMETAGVSTESARNAAPPSMAGIASHAPYLRINEYSAKMPPSPLLSMRMAMSTYLTVVISVIDQKTSDSMPSPRPLGLRRQALPDRQGRSARCTRARCRCRRTPRRAPRLPCPR